MSFKDKIFKNQSPWGTPPSGGGGRMPGGNGSGSRQDPPSLDDIIKNFQKTINKFSGGKSGGSRPIVIGFSTGRCRTNQAAYMFNFAKAHVQMQWVRMVYINLTL